MKQVIITLIVLAVHVLSNEAAIFTRLYYNNADCSGFHVAYNYMNSDDAPATCASGCTEWYASQFWVKEVCGEKVSPLYQEGFAVIRTSPDETCDADYSETGALAEMCIIWSLSPPRSTIRRTCATDNDNLMETGFSSTGCILETSTTGFDRTCYYDSSKQRSYSVLQCPAVAVPPPEPIAPTAAPSGGSNPVGTTPSSGSNPVGSTPSGTATPSTSNQPARSTPKSSGADSFFSFVCGVVATSAVTLSLLLLFSH